MGPKEVDGGVSMQNRVFPSQLGPVPFSQRVLIFPTCRVCATLYRLLCPDASGDPGLLTNPALGEATCFSQICC